MDLISKRQALEILEYWKFVELLRQSNTPEPSDEDRKITEEILDGKKVSKDRIEVFRTLDDPEIDPGVMLEKDNKDFKGFEVTGDELTFCIGRVDRNDLCRYLDRYMGSASEERSGNVYPIGSAISWFSFKTDLEGTYINGSFRLSPILWAICEWNSGTHQNLNYRLNKATYDAIIREYEHKLEGGYVKSFLREIYSDVGSKFVRADFENNGSAGFVKYVRYKDEDIKREDHTLEKNVQAYGPFIKDLSAFTDAFADGRINDKDLFGKNVGEYIMSAYRHSLGKSFSARISISTDEERESMRKFFEYALDIKRVPLGRIPSVDEVPCMSQAAINLITDESGITPLFSINVTSEEKRRAVIDEVIASAVVRKAELLASYENADSAFDISGRFINDKVNDYGVVVVTDEFGGYDRRLLDKNDVSDYIVNELLPMFEEKISDYDLIREDLLMQCKKVRNMRNTISNLCKAQKILPDHPRKKIEEVISNLPSYKAEIKALDKEIDALEDEIRSLNGSRKTGLFFSRKAEDAKKAMISERQRRLEDLKADRENKNRKYLNIKNYRMSLDTIDQYEDIAASVDYDFLNKFYASEELPNPWLTPEYNDEREKLYILALDFLKAFFVTSDTIRMTLENYSGTLDSDLLQKLFLVSPAISTTVEASGKLFREAGERGTFGQLFVENANGLQPQMILSLMFRSRKAAIMGDPKGSAPDLPYESEIIKKAIHSEHLNCYKTNLSAKFCADFVNPYGVRFGKDGKEWAGFPLDNI